jgi:TonB family protein
LLIPLPSFPMSLSPTTARFRERESRGLRRWICLGLLGSTAAHGSILGLRHQAEAQLSWEPAELVLVVTEPEPEAVADSSDQPEPEAELEGEAAIAPLANPFAPEEASDSEGVAAESAAPAREPLSAIAAPDPTPELEPATTEPEEAAEPELVSPDLLADSSALDTESAPDPEVETEQETNLDAIAEVPPASEPEQPEQSEQQEEADNSAPEPESAEAASANSAPDSTTNSEAATDQPSPAERLVAARSRRRTNATSADSESGDRSASRAIAPQPAASSQRSSDASPRTSSPADNGTSQAAAPSRPSPSSDTANRTLACVDCPDPPYPRRAQNANIEGVVQVQITVSASGQVTQVSLVRSSGHSALDQSVLSTVSSRWRFSPTDRGGTTTASVVMALPNSELRRRATEAGDRTQVELPSSDTAETPPASPPDSEPPPTPDTRDTSETSDTPATSETREENRGDRNEAADESPDPTATDLAPEALPSPSDPIQPAPDPEPSPPQNNTREPEVPSVPEPPAVPEPSPPAPAPVSPPPNLSDPVETPDD